MDHSSGLDGNADVLLVSLDELLLAMINAFCANPMHQAERVNGVVKNCAYIPCSKGFRCEYNRYYGQYICCGQYDPNHDYSYGKVRMYPGTSKPLQCFAKDQCLWVDTPNCVYSYRYQQNVCCSTFNC
ncbi:hypothetical protein OESDEN_24262 [Oesophagostomum dentatum]|uniref:EB module n=1 Tax=Oesophagostomum dentatum TaxID=61180 RepID=A0A0B1RTX9_OESDE|nr:hypothetical protein OESDEN_24262 [Oesophagostomum dentatum]